MTEPRTEAGRALLTWGGPQYSASILAIENQATELAAIEAEDAAPPALDADRLADDVRYAGENGTSDYWRGFNDGIDKMVAALSTGAQP